MKRILKHIAAILTFAIAMTGVSFYNAVTANAMSFEEYNKGTNNVANYLDTPFEMEIGDKKLFMLIDEKYWSYETKKYDWATSDESVVSMEIGRMSATDERVSLFTLTAQKAGTAVITGTHKNNKTDIISMTVIVKEATATQTSCKHSWKTTKKATCLRSGTKTCKKCHMKKSIKKKAHKWETYEETKTKYREFVIFECNYHTDDLSDYCGMLFNELDYGSYTAAKNAFNAHQSECKHFMGNWIFRTGRKPIGKYKATVTRCKTCDCTPEEAKQYE